MSAKYVCRTCQRAMRSQRPQIQFRWQTCRTLSSTSRLNQEPAKKELEQEVEELDSKTLQQNLRKQLNRDICDEPASGMSSPRLRLAQRVKKAMPETAGTYEAYGATEHAFRRISAIVDYDVPQVKTKEPVPTLENGEQIGVATGKGDWYQGIPEHFMEERTVLVLTGLLVLNLKPTFNTWAQLTMLHLYVLVTRIRALPEAQQKLFSQTLTDQYFTNAELKMDLLHSITSRSVRSKYLKDLFQQWRGVLVSYDEGLVKGDAVLAAAVWRNVFQGREDVDPVKLGMVVSWLRREVVRCGGESEPLAWARFGGLKEEESVVLMKSHLMDRLVATS